MNVLLIESDQLRWDAVGRRGTALTPNLDRLADRGVTFTTAYSNSPLCGPSRASSVTGLWCHEAGSSGNATCFDGRVKTYAHVLRERGVLPVDIGRMDFERGCDHGFDAIKEHPRQEWDVFECMRRPIAQRVGGYRSYCWDTEILDNDATHGPLAEVCEWLESHAGDERPWHLFANFNLPHPPFRVPAKFFEMYDVSTAPLPEVPRGYLESLHEAVALHRYHWNVQRVFSNTDIRLKRTIYYAMTTWLDSIVGIILDRLRELGIAGKTLVMFTSDHGENLGDHGMWSKGSFYDTSCRVPLIMAGPGVPEGRSVDTPVSLIDIAPTILDAFGVEAPERMRGHSLLPLARGNPAENPGVVFGEYHGHDAATGQFMVRTGDYKYIHHVGMRPQLFKAGADPGEMRDLGEDESYAGVMAEMEGMLRERFDPEGIDREVREWQARRLRRWLESTGEVEVKEALLECLGGEQYERLRGIYGLP
ncbi:MAG: sulfatase-like hydrolase/transferase [Planctomycetota bacterium]|jgi:choline-sulfatase